MKYSTMMALVFCGALALAVTGCKYDSNENAGLDAATSDVATDGNDGTATGADVATTATDDKLNASKVDPNAESTSIDAATGLPFDQDPNMTRCTDVDFTPVYFAFDASNFAQAELAKIEKVAEHLKANPGRVVMVEGNCDERGSNEYNLSLGDLRATAISSYLKTLGIAENRIQTKSYGEEKPAVAGQGEAVWSKNRRGEFAVYKHK